MEAKEAAIGKERIYLFAPAAAIILRITLPATIPADALQAAIGRAARRQATLCSRAELRADGSACFVPCAPAEPRVRPLPSEESADAALLREARTPFAIERGEWMRHTVFTENGKTVWLLFCHHMAGDGLALLGFVRDVLSALQNPARTWEREPFALCAVDSLPGGLPWPMRQGLRALNRQWAKEERQFTPADHERMTDAYWAGRTLAMARVTLEAPRLEAVLAACHAQRATLTGAWLAAIANGESESVGVAISIRPDGLESMANWAAGVTVRCAANRGDFWRAARECSHQIRRQTDDPAKRNFLPHLLNALSPTLIDAAYFAAFDGLESGAAKRIAAMFGYGRQPKGCSVTNLLRAPMAEDAVEEVAFYPPMVPNAGALYGMVTAGGALTVTLQCFADAAEARAQLNAALARLLKACEA